MIFRGYIAQSYPGQATSLKTVVLKSAPSDDVTMLPDNGESVSDKIIVVPEAGVASVNGTEVDLVDILYKEDGSMLFPLRQLCEAMEYEVNWIPSTGSVEIAKGETTIEIELGSMTY